MSNFIDGKIFYKRILIVELFVILSFVILIYRLLILQLYDSGIYKKLANDNTNKIEFILPQRGNILDRNGVPMTSRTEYYRLIFHKIDQNSMQTPINATKYFTKKPNNLSIWYNKILKKVKKNHNEKIILDKNLNRKEILNIEFNLNNLLGAEVEQYYLRNYPNKAEVYHITGFIAQPTEKDILKAKTFEERQMLKSLDARIGMQGLEAKYDKALSGTAGLKMLKIDAFGNRLSENIYKKETRGDDIKTTIDMRLQSKLHEVLKDKDGAIIVIDIRNGNILGMHSTPSVDPNMFVRGFDEEEWKEASGEYNSNMFYNKNLSLLYSPGSTFKLAVIIAALEKNIINPKEKYNCKGGHKVGNRYFHCHKKEGHGLVDMNSAIEQSCNAYFYNLATMLDIDDIYSVAKKLGLAEQFDIDAGISRTTLIPNKEWKMKKFSQPWYTGETANTVIGQGYLDVAPLNLAVMVARIASGKKIIPQLLEKNHIIENLDLSNEHLEIVRKAMHGVINNTRGAAYWYRIKDPNMLLCGKSGTAQVISKNVDKEKMKDVEKSQRSHGLFVGFAPCHDPKYAISVVVEHGQWGSVSAVPLASEVLKFMQELDIEDNNINNTKLFD